jgi:hypothetical protein
MSVRPVYLVVVAAGTAGAVVVAGVGDIAGNFGSTIDCIAEQNSFDFHILDMCSF